MNADTKTPTTIGFDEDLGRLLRAQGKALRDLTRSRAKNAATELARPESDDDCSDDREPEPPAPARASKSRR